MSHGKGTHMKNKFYSINILLKIIVIPIFFYSCKGADSGFAPSTDGALSSKSVLKIFPAAMTLAATNLQTFRFTGETAPCRYTIFTGSDSALSTTGNFTAP